MEEGGLLQQLSSKEGSGEVSIFFEIDILIVTMGSSAKDQAEEKVIRDVMDPFQPYIFSCLSLVYRTMLIFVFVLVSDGLTKQSN